MQNVTAALIYLDKSLKRYKSTLQNDRNVVTDKKINYFPSLLKEARKGFPLLIVMCPMEKDYSNPYKRGTASYLCNTIAMF